MPGPRQWPHGSPEWLPEEFLRRVWGSPHDLAAVDELMTEDYSITSGGREVRGRGAFKAWVREFQTLLLEARTQSQEVFASAAGDRVVSRWICTGLNNGIFGLVPDRKPIRFTGIAVWRVRDGRLAECWVERSGLEALRGHAGQGARTASP